MNSSHIYFNKRPSAANPLSKQRPNMVVSIFPPQRRRTTLNQNIINELKCFKKLFRLFIFKLVQMTSQNCSKTSWNVRKCKNFFFWILMDIVPAPAPSTTHFSNSTRRKMANAIHSSLTTTILSSSGRTVANATVWKEIRSNGKWKNIEFSD